MVHNSKRSSDQRDWPKPADAPAGMSPQIPVRALGSQGFKASCQGLGCMSMSSFYFDTNYPATEKESTAVIHKALELGVTLLDTSDVYGTLC